ncbi:MAG: hypothetical protein A2V62_07365 [Nitrospirae bacterium RBG_19FT_COMBO_58_9]|nr:MAG: hypothetical protein A2V62_07365 [Nitrospirae bacterium RBG_19FT_COMBO_58_9]
MRIVTRTIVMIHPGGLGDVLLAVPAMIRLRTRFPNHRLMLCALEQVAALLLTCRIIDDWTSVQGRAWAGLFAAADSLMGPERAWLENCDLAVGWMQDPDGNVSEALKAAGAREAVVRSPFSVGIQAIHQRDRFCEAINEVPSDREGSVLLPVPDSLLYLGQSGLEAAGFSIGPPLVVIHPGSGSVHKCVSPDILASVVATLQIFGANLMILEGPADREQVERLLLSCANTPVVLRGLDVLTVAGVLAQAQLFIGQDSGMTHLAGLLGVRTVALFGPTDPARWAPVGTQVTVLQGTPCHCQSWDDVTRCEEKPCLKILQEDLAALCLAHLKEAAVR